MNKNQIERQDFVDNAIHEMLEKLAGKSLEWNIEAIAWVRQSVMTHVVDNLQLMTEQEFYPYVKVQNEQVH